VTDDRAAGRTAADGSAVVPPRVEWPEPEPQSEAGTALTDVVLETFRLNGRLLEVAQGLAAEGGITAAWWQVLGAVLDGPRTVAEIGRRMGLTRQGVQRIADLLVERGLAEYRPNPAHRRAKLLACTEAGYWAVRRISLAQHPWADRVGDRIGADDLRAAAVTMRQLLEALDEDPGPAADTAPGRA
jgi:DNA-binding MarR family transcriptional regulator